MSSNNVNVFDHTGDGFIPLYDVPQEEIDGQRTSSISDYLKDHIHPPSTGYRLVDVDTYIEAIPNPHALRGFAKQVADSFRLKGDAIRKIMTETDSLMPLDHHIIPILDEFLSSLPDLHNGQGFAIQLQAELTINLKGVKREGSDKDKGAKTDDNPPKKRRKINYLIFRVDRAWGWTFIGDEPSSQSSTDDSFNARLTVYPVSRDDAESVHSQHDDDEPEDAGIATLPDQLIPRESEIPENEVMDDNADTDNVTGRTDYGKRSRKYFPTADDGISGRTKVFAAIEGKMAGIVFRCRDNLTAVGRHGEDIDDRSMSLLKQAYAYALSFRTQFVALYDYTTLVLIRWKHLEPGQTAAQLFKRWNTTAAAAQLDKEKVELTVVDDRSLMVPALAGFLVIARRESPMTWRP